MIETRILQSRMTLKGINTKDLADAQGWSMSTAYRKINGKVAWSVPELKTVREFLGLDDDLMNAIFFASELS